MADFTREEIEAKLLDFAEARQASEVDESVSAVATVRKEEDDKDGRQTIAFDAIETEIRLEEIADMLGIGSEQGLENAKRLLQDATN